MTRLEIYQRLRDIVDSSNVDDSLELITYCDKQIDNIERNGKDADVRKKELEERSKKDQIYIMETLNTEEFFPLQPLIDELRKRYPQRIWDKFRIKMDLGQLYKAHKIEKINMQYIDKNTLQKIDTVGYRKI